MHGLISNLSAEGSADEIRLVTACTAPLDNLELKYKGRN